MITSERWRGRVLEFAAQDRLLGVRNAVRRLVRTGEGVRQRARRIGDDTPVVPGLLSVVVPAYDVEDYIEESLDSISRQAYRKVEIIVVDDGSPDSTSDVVRSYRWRDPRVRLVRKQNQGLGAARNTGVEHARGEFLTFLDSDDTVERFAYLEAIESMNETGSDLAVMSYRRLNKGHLQGAAWWINEAHALYRPAQTIQTFPQIGVNAVAWTKVYRRGFWNDNRLAFPSGVLYEDQELSARAYALARSFDVIPTVGVNWRIREDQSSITQRVVAPKNVRDHWAAALASLQTCGDLAGAEVRQHRLRQYLNFNMIEFLPRIRAMDDDVWVEFGDVVATLLNMLTEDDRRLLDARTKVLLHLVSEGNKADALEFLELDGFRRHVFDGDIEGDKVMGNLPLRERLDVPSNAFELSPQETKLIAILRSAHADDDALTLRALVFVDSIDCVRDPQDVTVRFVADDGRAIVARSQRRFLAEDALGHTRPYGDPARQSWTIAADVEALSAADRWYIEVTAKVGEIVRVANLGFDDRSASSDPNWAFAGRRYALVADAEGHLQLEAVAQPEYTIEHVEFGDESVRVDLPRDSSLVALGWRAWHDRLSLTREITVVPSVGEQIDVNLPRWESSSDLMRDTFVLVGRRQGEEWRNLQAPSAGVSYSSDREWSLRPFWPDLRQTMPDPFGARDLTSGDVTLVRHHAAGVVDRLEADGDTFHVEGEILAPGRNAQSAEVLSGSTAHSATLRHIASGRFHVEVDLQPDAWGFGRRPLSAGTFSVAAVVDDRTIDLDIEDALTHVLPRDIDASRLIIVPHRSLRSTFTGRVLPAIPPAEREVGNALRLQREAASLVGIAEPPTVLLRSLYGEVANDSGLAVHERLMERGTELQPTWAVRDASVPVPPGSRVVVENTREYFEAFRRAAYLMVNVHQPDWHHKPEGQVIVQTFHGYPFKQNGLTWWRALGFSEERIESFMRRAREWDFLVSPATYATSPLLEFFPERDPRETRILEIGYPRNDALFGVRALRDRNETRRRLGIRDDQIAILHAPTFRDYLSVDDMTAALTDFLDYERLIDHFGDRVVILGRGHPFNARTGTRMARHVRNVTDYPDINHLISASDTAVLDYSSLRFDYALTGRPMIFQVPDRQRYFEGRTGFVRYEDTAPGPWVNTTDEVIGAVENLADVEKDHAAERAAFVSSYLDLEDGSAADRLIDAVFVPGGHVDASSSVAGPNGESLTSEVGKSPGR